MSVLFLDSFDHYADLAMKYDIATGGTISATSPRTGEGKLALSSGTVTKVFLFTTTSSLGMGFAVKFTGNPGAETTMATLAGSIAWTLKLQTDGTLKLYRDSTLKATIAYDITTSAWVYVEWRVSIGTTESYHVRINGITVAGTTFAQDTPASQTVAHGLTSAQASMEVDDLYLFEGNSAAGDTGDEFIGDCGVYCRRPTAEGAFEQWSPSAAVDNYTLVDETAYDGDTTYVETDMANRRDVHDFVNFPTTETNVAALQAALACKIATNPGTISVVATGGPGLTQTDFGSVFDLTSQSTYTFKTWTSSAFGFNIATLNGLQWGMRSQ